MLQIIKMDRISLDLATLPYHSLARRRQDDGLFWHPERPRPLLTNGLIKCRAPPLQLDRRPSDDSDFPVLL